MYRLAIFGVSGRMGRALAAILPDSKDFALTGALASAGSRAVGQSVTVPGSTAGVVITSNPAAALASADVAVDFTQASAVSVHVQACAAAGVPLLVATTGLDAATHGELERAAARIPLIFAPNTSLGVNLLAKLVGLAAQMLDDEFDADIAEIHHRKKIDAPSGTALKLGAAIARGRSVKLEQVRFDALSSTGRERPRGSIGFAVSRSGDVVGEHAVSFSGAGERLIFTHRATDRACFARGALKAARWLIGRPAGLYSMDDVLGI